MELKAVATELEKVKPPTPSTSDNSTRTKLTTEGKEELRKRWETACKEGKTNEVKKLLKEDKKLPKHDQFLDSNVTKEGTANLTPLAVAALNGHTEIVKILLKNHANKSRVSSWTPLEMAITGRHKETADLLISKGSEPKTDLPRDSEYYRRNADYRKREGLLINYADEFENYIDGLKRPKVEDTGP